MSSIGERELVAKKFRSLREEDERAAPPFERVWGAARTRVAEASAGEPAHPHALRYAATALLACAVVAVAAAFFGGSQPQRLDAPGAGRATVAPTATTMPIPPDVVPTPRAETPEPAQSVKVVSNANSNAAEPIDCATCPERADPPACDTKQFATSDPSFQARGGARPVAPAPARQARRAPRSPQQNACEEC